jgi:hypothetical protein
MDLLILAGGESAPTYRPQDMPAGKFLGDELKALREYKGRAFLYSLIDQYHAAGFGALTIVGPAKVWADLPEKPDATFVETPPRTDIGTNLARGLESLVKRKGDIPVGVTVCDILPSHEEIVGTLALYEETPDATVMLTFTRKTAIDPAFKKRGYRLRARFDAEPERYSVGGLFFLRPERLRLRFVERFANLAYQFRGDATTPFTKTAFAQLEGVELQERKQLLRRMFLDMVMAEEIPFLQLDILLQMIPLFSFYRSKEVEVEDFQKGISRLVVKSRSRLEGRGEARVLITDFPSLAQDYDSEEEFNAL